MLPTKESPRSARDTGLMGQLRQLGQTVLHQVTLSGLTFGLRQPIADGVSELWCRYVPGDPDQNRLVGDMLGNMVGGLWIALTHAPIDRQLRQWESKLGMRERVPHADDKAAYTTRHNATFILVPVATSLLIDYDQLASDSANRALHRSQSILLSVFGSGVSGGLSAVMATGVVWTSAVRMQQRPVDPTRPDRREGTIRACSAYLLGTSNALFVAVMNTTRMPDAWHDYILKSGGPLVRQVCWYGGRRALNALLPATPAGGAKASAPASISTSSSTSSSTSASASQALVAVGPSARYQAPPAPRKGGRVLPEDASLASQNSTLHVRDFKNGQASRASTGGASTSAYSPSRSRSEGSAVVSDDEFDHRNEVNVTVRDPNPYREPGMPHAASPERDLPSEIRLPSETPPDSPAASPAASHARVQHGGVDHTTPGEPRSAHAEQEKPSTLRRRTPAAHTPATPVNRMVQARSPSALTPMPPLILNSPPTLRTPATTDGTADQEAGTPPQLDEV